jgi:hypothetical protein
MVSAIPFLMINMPTVGILALISVISKRFVDPGYNINISGYFRLQYFYLLEVIPENLIAHMSEGDKFFVDLFNQVMLPSARKKVCSKRWQIDMGCTTVEAARKSIPRKDLLLAAMKRKCQKDTIDAEKGLGCG